MGNPVQAMPLRQSEHGSCVEKKMQVLASGLRCGDLEELPDAVRLAVQER